MDKLSNFVMTRRYLRAADRVLLAFAFALTRRHLEQDQRHGKRDLKRRWVPPDAVRNRMCAIELRFKNPQYVAAAMSECWWSRGDWLNDPSESRNRPVLITPGTTTDQLVAYPRRELHQPFGTMNTSRKSHRT
jgi:hypothetical protein